MKRRNTYVEPMTRSKRYAENVSTKLEENVSTKLEEKVSTKLEEAEEKRSPETLGTERFQDILIVHHTDENFSAYRQMVLFNGHHCKQKFTKCYPMPPCGDSVAWEKDMDARPECMPKIDNVVTKKYLSTQILSDDVVMIIFFLPRNETVCTMLTSLPKKGGKDILSTMARLCRPGLNFSDSKKNNNQKNDTKEWLRMYNKGLDPINPVTGFLLVKAIKDRPRDLYVDILCASQSLIKTQPGIVQFIEWAREHHYERIVLLSLPYVMHYYKKLGFRVDSQDEKDQDVPIPPNNRKAWCPLYPENDETFQHYMQNLSRKGLGGQRCDASTILRQCERESTLNECQKLFGKCYEDGFRMVLEL